MRTEVLIPLGKLWICVAFRYGFGWRILHDRDSIYSWEIQAGHLRIMWVRREHGRLRAFLFGHDTDAYFDPRAYQRFVMRERSLTERFIYRWIYPTLAAADNWQYRWEQALRDRYKDRRVETKSYRFQCHICGLKEDWRGPVADWKDEEHIHNCPVMRGREIMLAEAESIESALMPTWIGTGDERVWQENHGGAL